MNAKRVLGVMVGVVVVLAALSANAGVITSGLVSWWKFEEGSGTWADDAQSATHALPADANDGTLTNGPIWSSSEPTPPPTGKVAVSTWSLSFDAINDYVEVPAAASLQLSVWSLEAWVYAGGAGTNRTIIQRSRRSDGYHEYSLNINSNNNLFMSSDGVGSLVGPAITVNKWYHVVGTANGSTWYLYAQEAGGTLTSTSSSRGSATTGLFPNYIGAYVTQDGNKTVLYPFNGLIDDVRIYNRALTSAEVTQNYDAAFTTPSTIPEPACLGLVGMALLALQRRRK